MCSDGGNDVEGVWFHCDCTSTSYRGETCDIGIVEVPAIPLLVTNRPSRLLKLSAHPDDSLTVNLVMDAAISSDIQQIHFNKDVTSTFFQLTGSQEGVYTLSFELSGPAKNSFLTPSPLIILVKDDYILPSPSSAPALSSGCCEHEMSYYCISDNHVSLSSNCEWRNETSFATSGMVHINIGSMVQFPLSIAGLDISMEDDFVRSTLPSSLSMCSSCESACHSYIPNAEEYFQLLMKNTFKQAFLNASLYFAPDRYSLLLEAYTTSSDILYSQHDLVNFFGSGRDLINEEHCDLLLVEEDELYVVAILDSSGSFQYGNNLFPFTLTGNSHVCVAVSLSCRDSDSNHVILNVPSDLSNGFKDFLTQMVSELLSNLHFCSI